MVKIVLVIECQSALSWKKIFAGATIPSTDEEIQIEQATWTDLSLVCYGDQKDHHGLVVSLHAGTSSSVIQPDFVLLRSVSHGIRGQDSRNLLYGIQYSGIPCINTSFSEIMCLERPNVFGALKTIQRNLGQANFPLITQNYYPSFNDILVTPEFPCVMKTGHAHAGFGKVKINEGTLLQDVKGMIALHEDYTTIEPFIEWDYDMRIQKIGDHYRLFKRVSQNWKGNVGHSSIVSDAVLEPRHKLMVDECSKLFGGLDILGLDLLHPVGTPDDQALILELNTTAIGLVHSHEEEDMSYMKDLVIARMETLFGEKTKQNKTTNNESTSTSTTNMANSNGQMESVAVSEVEMLRLEAAKAKKEVIASNQRIKELEEELAKLKTKKHSLFGF